MAKNKVEIDVKVDDKGTTKKVGLGAKKAAEGLDKTAKNARNADRNLKGAAQASSNGTKNFSKMAQGMTGGLVPAYAAFAAQVFALSAAFGFLKNASDIENLRKSQISYAQTSGLAIKTLTKELRAASMGMLGFQEAAQASAIGVAKGFSQAQLVSLTQGATKASTALGRSFQDTFDRLLKGVSKAEPELLDELGITLRLETATQRYADAIGKSRKELTAAERSQAVFNETMRQLNDSFGSQEMRSNPFIQLGKTFEDIEQKITSRVLPVIIKLVDFINKNAGAAAAAFAALGTMILVNIAGLGEGIKKMFTGAGTSALNLGKTIGKVISFIPKKLADPISNTLNSVIDNLEEAQKRLQATAADAGRKVGAGAAGAVEGGASSVTLGKLSRGEDIKPQALGKLKKDLKRVRKELEDTGKTGSKAFAGMTLEAVKDLEDNLKKMGKTSLSTGEKIKKAFAKMGVGAVTGFAKSVRFAGKTLKGLGKGVGKVGKGLKKMGQIGRKAFFFITFIAGAVKLLDELAKKPMTFITNLTKFISGAMKMLARVINFISGGLNKLLNNSLTRKLFDIKEGDAIIPQIKVPDNLDELVREKVEQGVMAVSGKSMTQLEGIEKDTVAEEARIAAIKKEEERVKALQDSYAELGGEIKNIFKGISAKESGSKRAGMVATAVSSLPLASSMKAILAEKDPATKAKLQASFDAMFEGVDTTKFGMLFNTALKEFDPEAMADVSKKGADFNASLSGIKNAMQTIRQDIGTGDPLKARIVLEQLTKMARSGDAAAAALGEDGGLIEMLNEGAGQSTTDLLSTLQKLEEEFANIEQQRHNIAKKRLEGSQLPKLMQADVERNLKARESIQLLKEKQAALIQFEAANKNLSGTDAEKHKLEVLRREREIELLQRKANIAKKDATDVGRIMDSVAQSMESELAGAFDGIIQGTMSVKQAFASMGQSVLRILSRLIAEMIAVKLLQTLIGVSFADTANPADVNPDLNLPTPDIDIPMNFDMPEISIPDFQMTGPPGSGFSKGGIASGPTSGFPATLHGTEAIVPLPGGRSIPVEMQGSTQQQENNITINIASDGSQSEEGDSDFDGKTLGRAVAKVVQTEIQNQKRNGGMLSPYGVA